MTDAAIEHTEIVRRPVRRILLGSVRELALVPAIVVLFIVGIFTSPAFFTTSNFSNTAQFSAALGMVVVAESLILLTGSFDLSLQSIYGLAPMIGAWLIVPKDAQGLGTNWNPAFGILVVLGIGAAVGLFNGFMIVKLRFNAFIFTLAMLILLAGVVLLGMVNDVLVLRNTSTFWIDAVNGAIILVALALARLVALVRT